MRELCHLPSPNCAWKTGMPDVSSARSCKAPRLSTAKRPGDESGRQGCLDVPKGLWQTPLPGWKIHTPQLLYGLMGRAAVPCRTRNKGLVGSPYKCVCLARQNDGGGAGHVSQYFAVACGDDSSQGCSRMARRCQTTRAIAALPPW